MEKLPAYIVAKIERANRCASQAEQLNLEVENWMERNGCEYAFAELYDYREDHGYVVSPADVLGVVQQHETSKRGKE